MKFRRKDKPYHRRDWRRLWRYCRCGLRWTCPDRAEQVPMPYQPAPVPPLAGATYRAAVRAAAPAPVIVTADVIATSDAIATADVIATSDAIATADVPPVLIRRQQARNDRRPAASARIVPANSARDSASGNHENGRAGALTRAQRNRVGYTGKSRRTERV